jgi:glycosyltransferase involved in cell wall biosynthesis
MKREEATVATEGTFMKREEATLATEGRANPAFSSTEEPVRIAIVVSHPIQYFAPLYRTLAALPGIELKVIFCTRQGVETYFDQEFGIEFKWDIPLLEGYVSEFLPGEQAVYWLGLRGWDNPSISTALEDFQPDVVKVNAYSDKTIWRAVDWCHRKKVPVMLYSDSNASAQPPLWTRLIKKIVIGGFYRKLDGAFFIGNNNYQYHRRYGIPKERLFPGAYPIDKMRLTSSVGDLSCAHREIRNQYGIPADAFLAIFSGKLSIRKSPLHLLRAVEYCSARGANIWALFVGEGSERQQMEEAVRAHQMRNVVLAGFVNQSSIGKHYAASDVLVVPSAYDPHPVVVPEAGCFGLPVIASDRIGCIGATDTARIGENTLVYPYADVEKLANCLLTLCTDRRLYSKMASAAVAIANSQDIGVVASQLKEAAMQLKKMGNRR